MFGATTCSVAASFTRMHSSIVGIECVRSLVKLSNFQKLPIPLKHLKGPESETALPAE